MIISKPTGVSPTAALPCDSATGACTAFARSSSSYHRWSKSKGCCCRRLEKVQLLLAEEAVVEVEVVVTALQAVAQRQWHC